MEVRNECIDEILSDCVTAFYCPLGEFYPDKNFGSKIKNASALNNEKLLAYARQAVNTIDGVFIKSVKSDENTVWFDIMINDEQRQVSIDR